MIIVQGIDHICIELTYLSIKDFFLLDVLHIFHKSMEAKEFFQHVVIKRSKVGWFF